MRPPSIQPEFREWLLSDGYRLRGRLWTPTKMRCKQVIIYLHGIQSHGGWFEWSASRLSELGAAVILPDRRGSGLNTKDRGDVASWRRWLEDLDEIAAWISREFSVTHFDVVGVSWGGKIALCWALRRTGLIGRILLIAPGVFPAVDVGLRARLQIIFSLLTNPGRQFPIPLSDPALFTDNPAARKFITDDPLKLCTATARFFRHSRTIDTQLARTHAGQLVNPVTLLLAQQDRIIHNSPTSKWLSEISDGRAIIKEFSGAAHTLEFEADVTHFDEELRIWRNG